VTNTLAYSVLQLATKKKSFMSLKPDHEVVGAVICGRFYKTFLAVNYPPAQKLFGGENWGLYYKTFYGRNCWSIIISWFVCHFNSLVFIGKADAYQSLSEWSSLQESTLMVGSKQTLDYVGSEALDGITYPS
jgi:hypothetical protein